jgi:uncharacterized membrane protein YqgA involved in biofilm formation
VQGTIVNALAIIAGSVIGLIFRRGIPDAYKRTVIQAIGLAVLLVGLRSALRSDALLVVIISMAVGAVLGEALGIEDRLERLGQWFQRRFSKGGEDVAKGFVTASLIFCVGSMAIVGSLESGLAGNHQTLYAKSILDGVTSVVFTATFGIGVILSAGAVFCYQGAITLAAVLIKPYLTPMVVDQMSAVGGLLIMGIGINLLEIQRVRIANMLPAIFLPLVYYLLRLAFGAV